MIPQLTTVVSLAMMIPVLAMIMPVKAMMMPVRVDCGSSQTVGRVVLCFVSASDPRAIIIPALAKVVPNTITVIKVAAANMFFRFFIFSFLQF
jgi:hypothetical protein